MSVALELWWVRALVGAGILCVILALTIVGVELFGSATDERIAMTFLINLILVMGLQIFVGNSGVISFGHLSFMAVGAYTAAILTTPPEIKQSSLPHAPGLLVDAQLGFLPATSVAVVVTIVLALIAGIAIVRLSGAAAAVATLGLLVITHTVLSNFETLTRGAKAFYGIPGYSTLYLALALGVVAIVVARLMRESSIGLGLRSSREDELAARASGINVTRSRLVMWIVGAGITAIGGSLYAHYVLSILPSAFYFQLTFVIVTMVIVGGPSVTGAFIGAAGLSVLTEFLRRAETGFSLGPIAPSEAPGLTTIVLGLLIIGTMILRPNGLAGRWEVDDWLFRFLRSRKTVTEGEGEEDRGAEPSGPAAGEVTPVSELTRDPSSS